MRGDEDLFGAPAPPRVGLRLPAGMGPLARLHRSWEPWPGRPRVRVVSLGSRSLPPPTAEEKVRWVKARAAGCIACLLDGRSKHCGPVEIHHLPAGTRRAGHRFTVALGAWHHRGEPPPPYTKKQAMYKYGASVALSLRQFRLRYGTDQELLDKQDRLIGCRTVKIPAKFRHGSTERPEKMLPRTAP